ncbi:hypothetical protein RCL1_005100 [Eukaryota sp. TZLM3-RCL]
MPVLLPLDPGAAAKFFFFDAYTDTDLESVTSEAAPSVTYSSAEESSDVDLSDAETDQPSVPRFLNRPKLGREYFLKSTDDREAATKVKAKVTKPKREERKLERVDHVPVSITPQKIQEEFLSRGDINKKLLEVNALRGRKSVDKQEIVITLLKLVESAKRLKFPALVANLKLHVVSAIFDMLIGQVGSIAMPQNQWQAACKLMNEALELAEEHSEVVLDSKALLDRTEDAGIDSIIVSPLSLLPFILKLEQELTKSLQITDYRSADYQSRLDDELDFLKLTERAQKYYQKEKLSHHLIQVSQRQLEHLYFKTPNNLNNLLAFGEFVNRDVNSDITTTIKNLVSTILTESSSRDRVKLQENMGEEQLIITKTALYYVYHLALLGDFFGARDRFLMSHADRIFDPKSQIFGDASLQILYNRTIAVLGVAAFRAGQFSDCHLLLHDLLEGGKSKELLSQEKKRLVAFNMWISLEVLEGVYFLSSMLLEIPNEAMGKSPIALKSTSTSNQSLFDCSEKSRKVVSRLYKRHQSILQRSYLSAVPETSRDLVVELSKMIDSSQIDKAIVILNSLNIWSYFSDSEIIKKSFQNNLREAALLCFLLSKLHSFSAIPLNLLQAMFGLDFDSVVALISQCIVRNMIVAKLNLIKNDWFILCHNQPIPDPIALEILNLSEKCSFIVDQVPDPIE